MNKIKKYCSLICVTVLVACLLFMFACASDNDRIEISTQTGSATVINRNILINGDFAINQRGKGSYQGAGIYTVDRWRIGDGEEINITPLKQGVYINNPNDVSCYFAQPIELSEITLGITLTMSLSINGELLKVTGNIPNEAPATERENVYFFNDEHMRFGYSGQFNSWIAEIIIPENASFTVDYAKLEEGNISTAPYGITDSYAIELIKCQRFYRCYTDTAPCAMIRYNPYEFGEETYLAINVFLENEMRRAPILDSYNTITWLLTNSGFVSFNSSRMELVGVEKNRFQVLIFLGTKLDGMNGVLCKLGTVYITLNAEI